VTDEFMQAVVDDQDWTTHNVVGGGAAETYKARDIFRRMADAAVGLRRPRHPVRLDDQRLAHVREHGPDLRVQPVLRVHVPQRHRLQPGEPQPDEVRRDDGEFDVDAYRYAAKLTITAQEILVDNASYPTPKIEENSHKFRPLGLGYANLGALLMSRGLAYDSDEGRNFAAALTAIMHGEAYRSPASSPATTAVRSGPTRRTATRSCG
jgi:ribonucleoside-diphosphate reductase alpha chain